MCKKAKTEILEKAKKIFKELNMRYFEGKLPLPSIKIARGNGYYKAAILYQPKLCLKLAYPFFGAVSEKEMEQVILHEMIHCYLYLYDKDTSSILTGHSTEFKILAKKLGMAVFR